MKAIGRGNDSAKHKISSKVTQRFLCPMKHDLEILFCIWRNCKAWECVGVCKNRFHSSLYHTLAEPSSLRDRFPRTLFLNTLPGYLYGCLKVLISCSKWGIRTKTITCLQCSGDLSRVLGGSYHISFRFEQSICTRSQAKYRPTHRKPWSKAGKRAHGQA